jgi:hypothetical protein
MATQSISLRPDVSFFPSHISGLFSVQHCDKKYELKAWQKIAIVITGLAGVLLAGVGVLLGFCLSHYFRTRLVDQLMEQQLSNKNNNRSFFDARCFDGAAKETIGPVDSAELFYQQKQLGDRCGIYSLCNFAGHNIERIVPLMIQNNNDFWRNIIENDDQVSSAVALERIKEMEVYLDEQNLNRRGIATQTITAFMSQNKALLHLPEKCSIDFVFGLIDSNPITTKMQEIHENPHLHRALVFIADPIRHISAIRKDKAGQWRVLDSMSKANELQLPFPTLHKAVGHFLKMHRAQANNVFLFYPSDDTVKAKGV